MARIILTVLGVLVALIGALYQFHAKPFLAVIGVGRVIENSELKPCSLLELGHSLNIS